MLVGLKVKVQIAQAKIISICINYMYLKLENSDLKVQTLQAKIIGIMKNARRSERTNSTSKDNKHTHTKRYLIGRASSKECSTTSLVKEGRSFQSCMGKCAPQL
jgi:hypothetical protein